MATDATAAPRTFALWQKLVLSAYFVSRPGISITVSFFLEVARVIICSVMAENFSTLSSWLHAVHLPNDPYLPSRAIALSQPLYILAVLEAALSPVSTVAFAITIFRRGTTYVEDILCFGLIGISTVVAAVVLALYILVINSSLNVQALVGIRPDRSSDNVSPALDAKLPLAAFILFLVANGFQIVAITARHLILSSKRLPKQFRPFVMEKHGRTAVVGDPEAIDISMDVVPRTDLGPLERLYDDLEKQGLISHGVDLEVCRTIVVLFLKSLTRFSQSFHGKDFTTRSTAAKSSIERSRRRHAYQEVKLSTLLRTT